MAKINFWFFKVLYFHYHKCVLDGGDKKKFFNFSIGPDFFHLTGFKIQEKKKE
jgi:hypothetical protein